MVIRKDLNKLLETKKCPEGDLSGADLSYMVLVSFKNHLPISAAGRRLEHFFQVYAPNRVKDVPKLFHLYEGHVDKLFERVRRQYGVSETELPHVDVMHAHNEL